MGVYLVIAVALFQLVSCHEGREKRVSHRAADQRSLEALGFFCEYRES